jgi:flagellar hook-length control protein FliK
MMPNVTLGGNPAGLQQKGERSAKSGEIDGLRFDEALTIRSAERRATKGDGDDGPMDTRQDWKIDRYTALFRLDRTDKGKALSDTPEFGDLLFAEEPAPNPQSPVAADTETPADETKTDPESAESDEAKTSDLSITPDASNADLGDAELAFVPPHSSSVEAKPAKSAENANAKAGENQHPGKAPALTPLDNTDTVDVDPTPRVTVQPETPGTSKTPTAQVSIAERTAVLPAPTDNQPPARTRTAASAPVNPLVADKPAPVNAAVADKPAPITQPSTVMQQEGVQKPAPATPTAVVGETSGFVSAKETSFARSSAVNSPAAKADTVSAKVNVLNFTAAPAPAPAAPPVLSATATGIVAAIEAEGTWRAAVPDPTSSGAPRGASTTAGVNTLRIQLQPVELGMVTARLVATGSQLSVEIQVESNDARQRLANDSEAIVKALRAIGFDIDKVTIQQGPQNGQSSAQQGASGRNEQMQPDHQADRNARGRGDQGASGRDGGGARNGAGETMADRAGGGRYI